MIFLNLSMVTLISQDLVVAHGLYVCLLNGLSLGLTIPPFAAALFALFVFWLTLESMLPLLLLITWAMMQRTLH